MPINLHSGGLIKPSKRGKSLTDTPGRYRIDNNLVENAIRPLAIGRKNYLFCGNADAAVRAAMVYSLLGLCKAAGVNPTEWLENVLSKIYSYTKENRDMEELLPHLWKK